MIFEFYLMDYKQKFFDYLMVMETKVIIFLIL